MARYKAYLCSTADNIDHVSVAVQKKWEPSWFVSLTAQFCFEDLCCTLPLYLCDCIRRQCVFSFCNELFTQWYEKTCETMGACSTVI